MEDLIKALKIVIKYINNEYPLVCDPSEEVLWIADLEPSEVSEEDIKTLESLSFQVIDCNGNLGFGSYRFYN